MSILDTIVEHKIDEVAYKKEQRPIAMVKELAEQRSDLRSFHKKMRADEVFHFICEIKKASPSAGIIQPNFNLVKQAQNYVTGGASAISILTDEHFFMGQLEYLQIVREIAEVPILRKDFIIDEYQIYESKAAGADIILLIASILTRQQIKEYIQVAVEIDLDILLEISNESEIEKVVSVPQIIIGINNRDLKTFEVHLENSFKIKPLLPENALVISESGISCAEDCQKLQCIGIRGALIGEALMKDCRPVELLQEFVNGTRVENKN